MAGELYANFASRMLFKWWVFFKKAISLYLVYISKSLIFVLCFLFIFFVKEKEISGQKYANVRTIKR